MSKFQPQATTTFAFLCFGSTSLRARVYHISYIIWIHFDHFWPVSTFRISLDQVCENVVKRLLDLQWDVASPQEVTRGFSPWKNAGHWIHADAIWCVYIASTVDWCQYSCLMLFKSIVHCYWCYGCYCFYTGARSSTVFVGGGDVDALLGLQFNCRQHFQFLGMFLFR